MFPRASQLGYIYEDISVIIGIVPVVFVLRVCFDEYFLSLAGGGLKTNSIFQIHIKQT